MSDSGAATTGNHNHDPVAIKAAIEVANRAMIATDTQLQFHIDAESGRTVIKVVDTESRQIIRQIPTDEILVIARNIDKLQGLIIRSAV